MIVPWILSYVKHSPNRLVWLVVATFLLLSNVFLASCTNSLGVSSSTPAATPTPSEVPIAQLHWCGKPSMLFRDEGAITPTATTSSTPGVTATTTPAATVPSGATATTTVGGTPTATVPLTPGTPRTITSWSEVEAGLGFTPYLPATLPAGSCLVNAQATIHDPIIGGSFTIGYLLPDHSAFTLSQAPRISQSTTFQCNPSNGVAPQASITPKAGSPVASQSATPAAPLLLCSGVKDATNIVMSARGSSEHLQQIFNNLQPNIAWIPAS
jgi:hypothetical protein